MARHHAPQGHPPARGHGQAAGRGLAVGVLACCLGVAACSSHSSQPPAAGGAPTAAPPASAPRTTPQAPADGASPTVAADGGSTAAGGRCPASALSLAAGVAQQAMQHFSRVVVVRDVSDRACVLRGYPGVQLVGAGGFNLATRPHHGGSYIFPSVPPRPVRLEPGQSASFAIGGPAADPSGAASCPQATAIKVIPPNDTTQITLAMRLPDCGPVDVSPVVAGAAGPRTS